MSWGGGGSFGGGGGGSFGAGSMGGRSFDSFPGVQSGTAIGREEVPREVHPTVSTAPVPHGNDGIVTTRDDPDQHDHGGSAGLETTGIDAHQTVDDTNDAPYLHQWQDGPHERLDGRAFTARAYPDEVYKRRLKKHAFRLIKLSKGPNNAPSASLEEFKSFSTCPSYAALSWHWGVDTLAYRIGITNYDIDIAVRPTCYEMLWHLSRSAERSQYLWIDAVCINQEDPVEKAQQVSMMGHIYSQADYVVAYVGTPDTASEEVFQRARFTSSNPAHDARFLLQLMQRRWFSRSWVIQEVLLANRIVLQAGANSLEWSLFERYYEAATQSRRLQENTTTQGEDLVLLRRWYITQVSTVLAPMRKEIVRAGNMTEDLPPIGGLEFSQLYELMQRTWHYGVTLQRDKIFAVLSLFSEPFPSRLQPDYRRPRKGEQPFKKSDEQIFAALSVFMLKHCDCQMWSIGWRHVRREQVLAEQSSMLKRAQSTVSSWF